MSVNSGIRILITEGGVGGPAICAMAERHGLTNITKAEFIDAEAGEPVYVENPAPNPPGANSDPSGP